MERLTRYADLIVRVGANVQPDQAVFVTAQLEHADLVRAVTRSAYQAGARFVDVRYVDPHVRRAMIERAADDVLTDTRSWELAAVFAASTKKPNGSVTAAASAPDTRESAQPERATHDGNGHQADEVPAEPENRELPPIHRPGLLFHDMVSRNAQITLVRQQNSAVFEAAGFLLQFRPIHIHL